MLEQNIFLLYIIVSNERPHQFSDHTFLEPEVVFSLKSVAAVVKTVAM